MEQFQPVLPYLRQYIAAMAVGLALIASGEAMAQDSTPVSPPPENPQGTVSKSEALQQQGPGAAGQLAASVAGNFGEWVLVCANEKDDTGKKPCSLAQALVERKSQKAVFRVIFTHGPKGNLVLQVDGPIGVALQRGLEFSPDTKKIYRLPFQTCVPRGCRAVMVVEDDLKKELEASKKGSLTVYALNGQAVRTATNLNGLTDGLAALDKSQDPSAKAEASKNPARKTTAPKVKSQ